MDDLNKPLTLPQIQYVARDVLLGLEYLNEKRLLVHRDLKCANLLIGQDMTIKITNFDVCAKNSAARSNDGKTLNHDKRYVYLKSPHFTPPEILKCDFYSLNNLKIDIWSFGITCIEMAEMVPPLSNLHPEAIIDMAKLPGWQPPKLNELEKWPGDFSDFVTQCLEVKPDERPAASELIKVIIYSKF
jgi:serine/threonine protein kinase